MRHLVLVLRDQLDRDAAVLDGFDPAQDAVAMTEAPEPNRRFPEHKQRLVLTWSAQRHFRDELEEEGVAVHYQAADAALDDGTDSVLAFVRDQVARHQPERVLVTEPGDYRLLKGLESEVGKAGAELRVYADRHFLATHDAFEAWADGRKTLTLEYFYREQRKATGVLMDGGEPAGGAWNFDEDNRESFGRGGPDDDRPAPPTFAPDDVTRAVVALVAERFADHPGPLDPDADAFRWPVTPEQAEEALDAFIAERLPRFGTHQDAMWTEAPFLYHSLLASSLNLKLLDPRAVVERAEAAYDAGEAPINAVEGFVRQILGWREFVRGVYWLHAPDWHAMNHLDATEDLPPVFWDADTQMRCMAESVGQIVDHGYAHHIQRLMITGLFGLLYGIDPQQLNDWHEAMYVDAWPWASLPNMIGMSQYADGGIVGTKPYTASGKYVSRMSNYCAGCLYDPSASSGEEACPFSTLYWDFLGRHRDTLAGNRRMNFQLANLRRKSDAQMEAIRERAAEVRGLAAEGKL